MGAALRHPFGIALLIITLAVAGALRFLPGLESLSSRALWLALWGFLAYGVVVIAIRYSRPTLFAPELSKLQAVRRQIKAGLDERRAAEGGNRHSELTRIVVEAIAELDKRVEPELRQALVRQRALSSYFLGIEQGRILAPSQNVLERVQAIHSRQQATIEECLQQAANAAGTLVAMLQESGDTRAAASARAWAKDLLGLYDAIAEALRGVQHDEDDEVFEEIVDQSSPEAREVAKAFDLPPKGSRDDGVTADDLPRFVQEALRRLNQPSSLSRCELINRLPNSLAATRADWDNGKSSDSTPLKQAHALSEVLIAAIEGLKPARGKPGAGSPEALQYSILYEEYVRGLSTASIMVRHSISETTFHRNRREAIAAVAHELARREELLCQELLRQQSGT